MTDTALIQKLEEKVMMLLTELEDLRFEVQQLKNENASFKTEKTHYTQKLQSLISLLDSIDVVASAPAPMTANAFELEAMQGPDEYAID